MAPILRSVRSGRDDSLGMENLTVVVTPTHGFTAPWSVIKYCLLLPWGRGAAAAVVATRAGTKIGRLFLPGLDGTAAYILSLILFLRGYRIRGAIGIDMPSNWLAVHPGFKRENAEAIIARSRPKADRFFARIFSGRRFFGSWVSFPLGLMLVPVSAGYLLYGRILLGKLMFASNRCDGCGLCARKCPERAIRMVGRTPRPYWTIHCESCMRCMSVCPSKAVEASHALAVIMVMLVVSFPPALLAVRLVEAFFKGIPFGAVLEFVLGWALTLTAYCILYLLFSLLIRLRPIHAFFSYATLTRLFRRYLEPGTSIRDLSS